jgi:hypothetical protein
MPWIASSVGIVISPYAVVIRNLLRLGSPPPLQLVRGVLAPTRMGRSLELRPSRPYP